MCGAAAALSCAATPALMTADELPLLEKAPPGVHISYGDDPLQHGELTLPRGAGPYPVLVWIHGGCWRAPFSLSHTRAFARAAAAEGFAVWNLEYRRIGDAGGGWPGTFQDVARGTDHLRTLAQNYPLDLRRVTVGGHSAGGHLALWLAARTKIPPQSDLFVANPIAPRSVLALAPAAGLTALQERGTCENVIDRLIGGPPAQYPQRYAAAEPIRMAPLGVPQVLVVGARDTAWTWLGEEYAGQARAKGDMQITLIELPASGHFEMINPESTSWARVRAALISLR
jgi:acetyl esterase/lipase